MDTKRENDLIMEKALTGKKILVAEDDYMNFLYLKTVLSRAGCEMLHARDGKEAFNICAKGNLPDFIIMDLKMPEMDGFEATKRIKEVHNEIPVFAHSAYVLNNEVEKALASGCNGFIPKPIKKKQLLETIARYFNSI